MLRRIILISFLALITVSPVTFRMWSVGEKFKEFSPNSISNLQSVTTDSLLNFDFGNHNDCLDRSRDSVKIVDCQDQAAGALWQSKDSWNVKEAIAADLNRDGRNELVMVVWRPFKPWPIDSFLPYGGRINAFQDKQGMSCHIILIGWDGSKYRELWAGSSLIDPVFNIRAADLDGDGNQELITLEGKYDSHSTTGNLTVWDWSGFGFRLRDRITGSFSDFGIVSDTQNVMILSN